MRDRLDESYRYCGDLARREAKNFYYSFRLLPPSRRRSMCALYAFMRHTDDLADEPGTTGGKRMSLDAWQSSLDHALDGQKYDWPGLLALADAVQRHHIPRSFLNEVIVGVAMDLEPLPFATFEDLYQYCYRVASVVGLCCIHIWGYESREGEAERLAEKCGIALQLTNILRDVGEDARMGRIYLPVEDLERFRVTSDDLKGDQGGDRVRDLLQFQAERAYGYYREAAPLVHLVDPVGRPVLRAIVGIYRALLDEISRRDYDVLGRRVALSRWTKTLITLRSIVAGTRLAPRDTTSGHDGSNG